ncbi:MAG TPA: prolipoprotein diacylglyceryl transferase family protein, partial [Rudaea sp.]|nr:prolipoprotein diacylglyceryl transferase family protein [Rudaea sp.]
MADRVYFFDDINSIAFSIGPLAVHWYGLMYLGGFLGGWWLGNHRLKQGRLPVSEQAFSDLAFYAMIGVIAGGRVWYMLSYISPDWIWHDPLALFRVWDGGMS